MPLLRKQPFQRLYVSSDFRDDDEVYHCEVTNEIFKNYNEFCERIILCNSLIWSCSITGRTNMTFEEALQCEENAKKSLKEFPMELRIPILYLASKTNRSSFNEMVEDVFQFARDRYFVGEMVEASFTEESWCDCHVLQVIVPTEQQIKAYMNENGRNLQEQYYHPPAKLFRYEVEQLDSGDSDVSQLMIVEASQVRRQKQHYSRERNKIFLRQLCEQNDSGIWIVKESVLEKYGINKVRFDTIFAGTLPDFTVRVKKSVKQKQESIDKFLTSNISKQKTFEKSDPLKKVNDSRKTNDTGAMKKHRKPRTNGKFKEELKAKALEEKAKRKAERALNSEHKKEKKQKLAALAAYMKQWNKPREDLECEDLCPIPEPTVIKCNIPNEKFGDFVMISEFLEFFNEELDVSVYFPGGFNLELLEKILLTKEASGPWSDLLQLLLSNIFKYQTGEDNEIDAQASSTLLDGISPYEGASSMAKAVKLATIASRWCTTYQGCKLSELTLDHITLSEILRQHLLSSGGRISEAASKWRYSQKGGYTNFDEPALLLRINDGYLLRLLGHRNVCELDLDDKIKIVTCLINQLLTFASIRDAIEERYDKLHQAKKELKLFLLAEQKKEKEEKEKMREREKEGKVEEDEPKLKKITRGNYEEEKKKEEYENKLKELQQASRDDKMMLYLGSDRAHRRYWRFISVPGLFVENDERWPGSCLSEGTPHHPELQDKEATYAYLRNKFEDEFSDKENSFKKSKKSPKKILSSDKNGVKSPRKETNSRKEYKQDLINIKKNLVLCTGDKDCPVHCKRSLITWSFYGNAEDIQALIDNLSTRGIRESELRNNLLQEMDNLLLVINDCPKYRLNPDVFSDSNKGQTNKMNKKNKYENANLNFPSDVAVDEVMEMTLRDHILDFEDKINAGCLGSLKIIDRTVWRNAINKRSYDKQCDKLMCAGSEIDIDIPPSNTLIDKIKNESKHSRPGTPDSEVGSINIKTYIDPGMYLGLPSEDEMSIDQKQQAAIKQMACAILQLSHAIEQRYLQRPLGPDQKDKKWSGEEARERWEQSLIASTNWSQLFVHLSTLHNSVAWHRSALNAQCRICRRRRDAENMLLCDGCNRGHHLYCLKPKLNAVPAGDWFCTACRPPEIKLKEKAQKRKRFEDEIEDEVILTKETRHNRAKRIPQSDDENDQEDDEDDEDSEEDINMRLENLCALCKSGGKVISCDTCPNYYHLECVEPPLSRAPRGRWSCSKCKPRRRNVTKVRGRERERDKERLCAAAARSRIHGFAKSLLTTESTDWDDSSASDDTEPRQTRRATKRAAEIEHEEDKNSIKGSMAKLQELLTDIRHHRDSWPFLSPVTKDEVPDYHDIISNPMDFGTIKYKLGNGDYETLDKFFSDCQLIFENCRLYNKEHSSVYNAGMRLRKYFEKRCKELSLNFNELSQESKVKRARFDEDNEENCTSDSEDESEAQKRR
ncbi:Bromodomain adjacent to zinc finger domain protein 1A [Camponotus floridanus]|uniref:Bromodomain adjacent to zinc finger domain protein 1A n=1 Tax=Camponotus floridanus TaxID=104421 RepID=E2ARX0_CAMFO|nr:bromodomain adjacent to zinc finger domain protein 1A isoform X2 [Camponotus floridanus]EFN63819.1 Bromodomain adjacent to zinc finger domain protein 1A [Camponotus floridanus]